jgi:hypothetical protein
VRRKHFLKYKYRFSGGQGSLKEHVGRILRKSNYDENEDMLIYCALHRRLTMSCQTSYNRQTVLKINIKDNSDIW